LSRRLGVEAMEGRLMLATTGIEFEPVDLPLAPVAVGTQDYAMTSAPAVWVTRLKEEGGFITSQYSWDAATNGGTAFMLGDTISNDTLNNLIEKGHVGTTDAGGMTRGWLLVNEYATDSGGIQPVVVVVADSNADVSSALRPILSQYNGAHVDSDEGGSIPIEGILANTELERGSDVGRPVRLVSLTAENSGDSAATANLAAVRAANAGISGEWARAMVFELAGGEPERDGGSSSSNVDLNLQDGGPLSSARPQGDAEQEAAQNTGAPRIPDMAHAMMSAAMPGGFNSLVGDGSAAGESDLAPLATKWHSSGDNGGGAGQGTGAASLPATVFETAFEQIGGSTQSVLQSLAAESWHRSFGVAPLLMVLALERIAAGNSRRANRDAAPVAVRRPKLNRLADDTERT
jgi:hypothetical protein